MGSVYSNFTLNLNNWQVQKTILEKYGNIKVAFIVFDSNNNHFINYDELSRKLVEKGISDETDKHKIFFDFMDKDKDGRVSWIDWNNGFRSITQRINETKEKLVDLSRTSNSQNLSETANNFLDVEENNFDSGQKRVHDILNKYAPEVVESERALASTQHQQGPRKTENFKQFSAYPSNVTEERPLQHSARGHEAKRRAHELSSGTEINSNRNQKPGASDPQALAFPHHPYSERTSEKKFAFGTLSPDPNTLLRSGGDTQGVYEDLSDRDYPLGNNKPIFSQGTGSIRPAATQHTNQQFLRRQPEASKSSTSNRKAEEYDKSLTDKGGNKVVSNSIPTISSIRQNPAAYDEKQMIEDFDFYSVSDIPKTNRDEHFLTPGRSAEYEQNKSSGFLEVAFETPVDRELNRYKTPGTDPRGQYSNSQSLTKGFSPEEAKVRDAKVSKQQQQHQLRDVLIQDQGFSPNYKHTEQMKSAIPYELISETENSIRNRMPTIREQESEAVSKASSSRNWDVENSPGLKNRMSSDSANFVRISRNSEKSTEPRNIFSAQNSQAQKIDELKWQTSQFNSLNPSAKEPADKPQEFRGFYAQRLPFQTSKPLKSAVPDRQNPQRPTVRPVIRNKPLISDPERKASTKSNFPNFRDVPDNSREKEAEAFSKTQEPNLPFKDLQSQINNPKFDPKKQNPGEFRVLNLAGVKKRLESNQKPQTNVTATPLQDNKNAQLAPRFNPSVGHEGQSQNKIPQKIRAEKIKIQEDYRGSSREQKPKSLEAGYDSDSKDSSHSYVLERQTAGNQQDQPITISPKKEGFKFPKEEQKEGHIMEYTEFKRALGDAELHSLKRFNNLLQGLKAFDLKNEKTDSLDEEAIQLEAINFLSHRQELSPEKDRSRSPKERLSAQGSTEYECFTGSARVYLLNEMTRLRVVSKQLESKTNLLKNKFPDTQLPSSRKHTPFKRRGNY